LQEASIEIQNIVAFVDLQTPLDLDDLATKLPGSYRRERFPALIVKFKQPKISFLIFRNGKMNCTGANHISRVKEGVKKLVNQLRDLGVEIEKDPPINVTNLVATVDLGLELNLDELALNLDNVEYEPETFPGLVYRPYESRASVLVFGNGKLVVAGFREEPEGNKIVEGLLERLKDAGLIASHE
jgi:transcription initiation factor TFIID TATA-box-binding protein